MVDDIAKQSHPKPPQGAALHGRRGVPGGPAGMVIGGLVVVGLIGYFTVLSKPSKHDIPGPSGGKKVA